MVTFFTRRQISGSAPALNSHLSYEANLFQPSAAHSFVRATAKLYQIPEERTIKTNQNERKDLTHTMGFA
jgi:hypothetical protein